MDDKKATIIKILETAIQQEIKAKEFYFNMAMQLSDKEAQSRFRHMAEAEQEHEDILKSWYEETCGHPLDLSKLPAKEFKPPVAEPGQHATLLDVIKLIAKVENKAFQFYKEAALLARSPEEKRMFERLADLEQLHADQTQTELEIVSGETLYFNEQDVPWEIEKQT